MDSIDIVDKPLTRVQERAVELVKGGLSDREVSAAINLSIHTLRSWKNPKHGNFRQLFAKMYYEAGDKRRRKRAVLQEEEKVGKLLNASKLNVTDAGMLKRVPVYVSKWSEETGARIIKLVGRGMTQKEICKEVGISSSTLCAWKNPDNTGYKKGFAELYEYAYKYEGSDTLESEAKAIADDNSLDMYEEKNKFGVVSRPNSVSVLRARLQVETIRWMCAIRNREKYGKAESKDSVSVETSFVIQQFGSGGGETHAKDVVKEKEVVAQNRISKEN